MLADIAANYPVVLETFTTASAVLGFDLWQLTQQGPERELNLTYNTQPAMLAAGVALWRVWQQRSAQIPSLMAGHSLGEYTALVCAGSLDFAAAVELVTARGHYMQEAVPAGEGGMAAILGLTDEQVREICASVAQAEIVSAVNYNSPGQVVVAGHMTAVTRAIERAREVGAKRAVLLPVSVPSHCALMRPAAQNLAQRLQQLPFAVPRIPVVSNVDVVPYTDAEGIRDGLTRQLYSPVRWSEVIQKLASEGGTHLLECGPGRILIGLNKRIVADMKAQSLDNLASLEQALAS